jgi:hypothetical protein
LAQRFAGTTKAEEAMSPEFRQAVEALHTKFEHLITAAPHAEGASLPKQGVYLFSENGAPFYVGLTCH